MNRGFGYGLMFAALAAVLLLSGSLSLAVPRKKTTAVYYVTTIAGTGNKGYKDGAAGNAMFNWPTGIVAAADGTIFVADYSNHRLRRIDPSGIVSTLAGSGRPGYADGKGSEALLWGPDNIAMDHENNILVADADNFRIRKTTMEGVVTTVAGNGHMGYRDGEAVKAMFGYPTGVAADEQGRYYVADRRSHTVRLITAEGKVSTIAGIPHPGLVDGIGMEARFREPISVAVGSDGVVYVADSGNNAIRKITPDGKVTTLAGGVKGYRDGTGADAMFNWPTGIAVDSNGNIFVCDSSNNKIRRVTPGGVVSTVAGGLLSGSTDGIAWRARFKFPTGIGVDSSGNIYVADSGNNLIRKISAGTAVATIGQRLDGPAYAVTALKDYPYGYKQLLALPGPGFAEVGQSGLHGALARSPTATALPLLRSLRFP